MANTDDTTGDLTSATGPTAGDQGAASDDTTSTDENVKDGKFTIPKIVADNMPDLVELIKETESMNDDERQYWFQILPIMTEEQIAKFREILENEKEQLAKLDQEYEEELKKINKKHASKWKAVETKEEIEARKKAEKAAEVEEKAAEEKLLEELDQT